MAIQDKFNRTNVIYKITKDIDLKGETLTIPEGCTLDFQGGSFSNGTIEGNNTLLLGSVKCNIIKGSFLNDFISVDWLGAKGDGIYDNTNIIQSLLDNISIPILIPIGEYAIYNTLLLKQGGVNYIIGEDRQKSIICAKANMDWMFKARNEDEDYCPSFKNLCLDGGVISIMDSDYFEIESFAKGGIKFGNRYYQALFENIYIKNIEGTAVLINHIWYITFRDIWISRCIEGMVIQGENNGMSIKDSWFNIIKRYGLFTTSNLSFRISFCNFENIGNASIVLHNGGQTVVENCYFEQAARNGVIINDYDGNNEIKHIYSEIILSGRYLNYNKDSFDNGGGNIINATICNNDIQKNKEGDFIFASNVSGLSIYNNILRYDKVVSPIFACAPKYATIIENILIYNNIVVKYNDGFYILEKKWNDINMYSSDNQGTVNNIKTDADSPFIKEGITNFYHIETNSNYIKTRSDRPNNPKDGTLIFDYSVTPARPLWFNKELDTWVDASGLQPLNDKNIIETQYDWDSVIGYVGNAKFVARNNENVIFEMKIHNNGAGFRISNNKGESWSDWISSSGEYFDIKKEGTQESRPTPRHKGFQYYDTTLNKPIWWNGSNWVDATGAEV